MNLIEVCRKTQESFQDMRTPGDIEVEEIPKLTHCDQHPGAGGEPEQHRP
jgi:hypothetical protein